jgi:4-hydroxy-tetrahydrodipicolinate synthase
MKFDLGGIITPVVTPFTADEDLDLPRLRSHLDHLIKSGVKGIFPLGTAGEFALLGPKERDAVIKATVDQVNGRVPVLAGVSDPGTRNVVEYAKRAADLGADAVVVTAPYYVKTDDEGVYQHYRTVAESVDVPVVVYNIPSTTGRLIDVGLAKRICEIDSVIGMKFTTDDLSLFIRMVSSVGAKVPVMIGSDSLIFSALGVGAAGAVVGSSNVFPALTVEIYDSYRKGDLDQAWEAQMRLMPFVDSMFLGTFPAALKEALALMGKSVGPVRMPLVPLGDQDREKLRMSLGRLSGVGSG